MADLALGVTILWAGEILATRFLGEGDVAPMGDTAGSLAPIAVEPFVFGAVVAGRALCGVPAGRRGFKLRQDGVSELLFGPAEIEVGDGEQVRLTLGAFTLVATAERRPSLVGSPSSANGRRRRPRSPKLLGVVSAVALAHVAALALGLLTRPSLEPRVEAAETAAEVRILLAQAEARAASVGKVPGGELSELGTLTPVTSETALPTESSADDSAPALPVSPSDSEELTCRPEGPPPVEFAAQIAPAGAAPREGIPIHYWAPGAGVVAFLGLGALAFRGRLRG